MRNHLIPKEAQYELKVVSSRRKIHFFNTFNKYTKKKRKKKKHRNKL